MTTLTINWGNSTRVLTYLGTDNNVSSYASRTSADRIDIKVNHVKLKTRSASGQSIWRHDVNYSYTSFGTPTVFATTVYASFSFSAAEDVDAAVLTYITNSVSNLAGDADFIASALENAPARTV